MLGYFLALSFLHVALVEGSQRVPFEPHMVNVGLMTSIELWP